MLVANADIKSTSGNIDFDVNSNANTDFTVNANGFGVAMAPSANLSVSGNSIVSETLYLGQTSGTSTLDIAGSIGYSIETVSDNTTLTGNSMVLVDTSSANVTITLPDPASSNGREYTIKKITSTGNVLILTAAGNIDNKAGTVLASSPTGYPFIKVASDGSHWQILSQSDGNITNTLLNMGLVSYWNLDEASGTRSDSLGLNDASDGNNVLVAAGVQGNAALFSGGNFLQATNSASLTFAGNVDITMAGWFYLSNINSPIIFGKYKNAADRGWAIGFTGTTAYAALSADGSTQTTLNSTHGAISANVWYFAAMWHDSTEDKLYLQVNETVDSVSFTTGIYDSQSDMQFGRRTFGSYLTGRLDEIGIWNRVLSPAERALLYNGGNGMTYPFDQ